MRRLLLLGLLLLTATGCPGEDDDDDDNDRPDAGNPAATATIRGQLTPFRGNGESAEEGGVSREAHLPFSKAEWTKLRAKLQGLHVRKDGPVVTDPDLPIVPPPVGTPPLARIPQTDPTIPGDVILRFEAAGLTPEHVLEAAKLPGYRAVHKGYASEYLHLVGFEALDGHAVTADETRELVAKLATLPGVRYADRNLRVYKLKVPNDKGYSLQWHYPTINLPAAWDIESDATGVVVAVIDTGIVSHPDLDARVLPGYDMIQDATNAGDGNGRDSNPQDVGGDEPNGGSSWHGTHVAGTVGALTNNTIGVAGVTWNARILPVRVLGKDGGSGFDIAAAVTWATGGNVPGIDDTPTPAKVVNMSLGGPGAPQKTYQDVINAAVGRGAIFVIAAGNENVDASNSTPCNQENVICVGSTNFSGRRSSFSNFGAKVDVMASGGEMTEDLNGDGYPDGVLSTARDENNQPAYVFLQGTSMATPHVAGVVALMAAASAKAGTTLTPALAESVLKSTATAIPASQCSGGCGAGLINAQAALARVANLSPGTLPPQLNVTTSSLFFRGSGVQPLTVSNVGGNKGGDLAVTATVTGTQAGAVSFPSGATVAVPAFGSATLNVAVNTAGLPDGDYTATLNLTGSNLAGSAGTATVLVKISVGTTPDLDAVVAFVWQDEKGKWQASEDAITLARASAGYAYSLKLVPRTYYSLATIDDDQDGELFEEGERTGYWRNLDSFEPLELEDDQTLTGVSYDLVPLAPVDDNPTLVVGGTCSSDASCPGGYCVTGFPGGYCTQDCSTAACPVGSKCYIVSSSGTKACLQTCTTQVGTGQGDCRDSNYVCYSDGTGVGACQPNCKSSGLSCATGKTCASDGFCR
ncbi:S8 family peptidase [Pyxidicoccus parkwayensis]|uniref:S8 family peptidase n=1 Tax=Pyxidicoccus parkwayensis TaxID=2813578 RepID=A0ABX7NN28_9BACT|nr:S8 family peptidase [Pyxidicoccus parkwaysis]QSQ20261.1 S8 family peptidase [Pyxidicoccus parkwaysis]